MGRRADRHRNEEKGSSAFRHSAVENKHEPNKEGVYPDWADPAYVFKFREMKIVNLFENHRANPLVSKRASNEILVTDSEGLLGVNEKQAEKFSKEWYNIKRQETAALWEQRQDIFKEDKVSMVQFWY